MLVTLDWASVEGRSCFKRSRPRASHVWVLRRKALKAVSEVSSRLLAFLRQHLSVEVLVGDHKFALDCADDFWNHPLIGLSLPLLEFGSCEPVDTDGIIRYSPWDLGHDMLVQYHHAVLVEDCDLNDFVLFRVEPCSLNVEKDPLGFTDVCLGSCLRSGGLGLLCRSRGAECYLVRQVNQAQSRPVIDCDNVLTPNAEFRKRRLQAGEDLCRRVLARREDRWDGSAAAVCGFAQREGIITRGRTSACA